MKKEPVNTVVDQLIIYNTGETGDTIHVAGALALNKNTRVLVIYTGATNDQIKALRSLYLRAATDKIR